MTNYLEGHYRPGNTLLAARSLDQFVGWLRAQPPSVPFCQITRTHDCPLARYAGGPVSAYGGPDWAMEFVNIYDGRELGHDGQRLVRRSYQDALDTALFIQRRAASVG